MTVRELIQELLVKASLDDEVVVSFDFVGEYVFQKAEMVVEYPDQKVGILGKCKLFKEVNNMSSISVGELKSILDRYDDDDEVVMYIRHKYDISKESGEKGWCAYINGVGYNKDWHEIRLMN